MAYIAPRSLEESAQSSSN